MDYHRNKSLTAFVLENDETIRWRLWNEWLDTFYLADDKQAVLDEKPPLTGTTYDAIAAAGVAWLARKGGLLVPEWTKGRRAQEPWWGEYNPKSRSARINQILAPPEFFSRNLFVSPSIMYRARMPIGWIEKNPKIFSQCNAYYYSRG